jgi:acyl-CoA synthetase (AMP-forming)/AMP-acid ligase II
VRAGRGTAATGARPAPELGLLQLTSGSSGPPRGVCIPLPALEANIAAIRAWLEMTPDDATASWLPVHHDMGLIGCLLTPFVNGSDVRLLQPEDFVRDPLRWLRCFGDEGAALSATPAFGLAHVARRVQSETLRGWDLSRWRTLIVGAERLSPTALEEFERLLAPAGFPTTALRPAYGLAEATLAVTGLPLGERWRATRGAGAAVVGSGRPLAGVSIRVVDGARRPLREGRVGEIAVTGASVAAGYAGDGRSPALTCFRDGVLYTGDAGFLADGQLFVLGRLGDALKMRGLTVFAEEVEAAVVAEGLPSRRVGVALGYRGNVPTAFVALEAARADWAARAASAVRRMLPEAEAVVAEVSPGTIPRTTSGKTRRRALWEYGASPPVARSRRSGHDLVPATKGADHA